MILSNVVQVHLILRRFGKTPHLTNPHNFTRYHGIKCYISNHIFVSINVKIRRHSLSTLPNTQKQENYINLKLHQTNLHIANRTTWEFSLQSCKITSESISVLYVFKRLKSLKVDHLIDQKRASLLIQFIRESF